MNKQLDFRLLFPAVFLLLLLLTGCQVGEFHVYYDGNGNTGGTVPVDPNAYEDGSDPVVLGNTGRLTKEGFSFAGWSDIYGYRYFPESIAGPIHEDIVLYAVWASGPGTLDPVFDAGAGADSWVYCVKELDDGRILAAGSFSSFNSLDRQAIVRLDHNGAVDETFDAALPDGYEIYDLEVQDDGRILVAGYFPGHKGVMRLNTDGSQDTGFDADEGETFELYCLAVQDDGKVLIGGPFDHYAGVNSGGLARLNPDGSADTGFGLYSGYDGNYVYDIVLYEDGKILIGADRDDFNVVVLDEDGSVLHTDFRYTGNVGYWNEVNCIGLQPDGKIIAGGGLEFVNSDFGGITRMNPNGSEDTGFQCGSGFSGSYVSPDWTVYDFTVLDDGRICVVGGFSNYNDVFRPYIVLLEADGTLDDDWFPTDMEVPEGPDFSVFCIDRQDDGKFLIGGAFAMYTGSYCNGIARVLAE
ncbi:MAG: hypothetical protein JW874_13615 [Spirochaetales bacterium]|nr:hypothetical protein [Spirochaetales bacterium]